MKILYGVLGEGMGHATRSHVVLNHLANDHEIIIVASGKAYNYLKNFFPFVVKIDGFKLVYRDNKVDIKQSVLNFLSDLPNMLKVDVERFWEVWRNFTPDAIISDFESFAYTFGIYNNIPIISIDNMHILDRCKINIKIPLEYIPDYSLAKAIIRGKLPGCYHYMITSFFFPPVKKKKTTLYPPILRDGILNAKPSCGDHILDYRSLNSRTMS